ncbi:TPA: DsbA family protein [Mannheimia haemolytica]
MPSVKQVKIYNFTDPMMGLSYESEPFFRQLDTHFGDKVALEFVMGGLVRDVADFMIGDDFKDGKDHAFKRYNARLAKIYEAEQVISGMPIKMDRLALFDETHTSSLPLNLAFKAVEIISPHLAEPFLYRLRFATIVEQRMTTDERVLADVATQTGIAKEAFFKAYHSDTVKHALQNDFDLRAKWGIRALPAYLFCYGDRQILKTGVLDFDGFASIIRQISDGQIVPTKPTLNTATLQHFVQKRPLVSLTEIRYAFDLADNQTVLEWLGKIEQNWRWFDEEFLVWG